MPIKNYFSALFVAIFMSCGLAVADDKPKFESNIKSYKSPEIGGIAKWFNSSPLKIADQKGKVVLIDFWTYSCINCIRSVPFISELQKKYADRGLVIISVHSPEFDFERDEKNIAAAIKKFDIKYPVAVDNDRKTWDNFSNLYWPAHYLIDQQGNVVFTHFGEGETEVLENNIRALLGISGVVQKTKKELWFGFARQTPETYLGFDRADRNANEDQKKFYFPKELPLHYFALGGSWKVTWQYVESSSNSSTLRLHFQAKKVFLVMESADGKPVNVELLLNDRPILPDDSGIDVKNAIVKVSEARLYDLVKQKKSTKGILEIRPSRSGVRAYAFTFGS